MEKNKDFYLEFIDTLNELLLLFINRCQHINQAAIYLQELDFSKVIIDTLWLDIFFPFRDKYNNRRLSGNSKEVLKRLIWNCNLKPLLPTSTDYSYIETGHFQETESVIFFKECKGAICFYCYNLRQLYYFLPILEQIRENTIIFYNFDLENFSVKNDYITFVEFQLINEAQCLHQSFLKRNFFDIFQFTNNFLIYLSIFKPKCIVLLEGCHPEMEALSVIGKQYNIPSICIQQGWPSVMHSRFRNMNYNYFLTWGNTFNNLWRKYNPAPKYVSMGYCHKVPEPIKENIITFFLQAPIIILNKEYLEKILEFASWCAESFPCYRVWLREHPEYKIDQDWLNRLSTLPNLEIKTGEDLGTILASTKISVSAFSSTLMESLAYHSIPFVLEFSSAPFYPQNIKEKKLGYIVGTLEEAKKKMNSVIYNQAIYEENLRMIFLENQAYFSDVGDSAVKNILNFLKKPNYNLQDKLNAISIL
ncbi:hypothetical protein ACR784_22290 [Sphingobacterium multivorum]|uniref:Uncharacterized protein n=1 Tax=Sphingobacterium thalpophilum TaxID=259 RepID=A0ACD5BWL0_9SPHI